MNHGLLNLMDHYYGEKQCMFFTMLWIIMDLLDLIMDYWIILDYHMKTPGVVFILCNQHSMV